MAMVASVMFRTLARQTCERRLHVRHALLLLVGIAELSTAVLCLLRIGAEASSAVRDTVATAELCTFI